MSKPMIGQKYVSEDNPLPVYIVGGGGVGSDGDMKKEIYDPNDNGYVDRAGIADSVSWNGITEQPSDFPPSTHNHNDLYYEKTESDGKYQSKGSYATTAQLATGLGDKADSVSVYTKVESDGKYASASALGDKADTVYVDTELGHKLTASKVATQSDSVADDIDTLVGDFNGLLAKLKTAGIMIS